MTATNVFAHIQDVNSVLKNVSILLDEKGVFVSENHYFIDLIQNLQYDAIYHEHLRYYSLTSLSYLFELHDLEIFHAVKIPTHGGSIRVYACRRGLLKPTENIQQLINVVARDGAPMPTIVFFFAFILNNSDSIDIFES